MKPRRTLNAIVDLIVRCCDPQAIILFGSYAKGGERPDSDIDLLMIGDFTASRHLRAQELADLLDHLPVRVDLHLLTQAEWRRQRERPLSFISTLQTETLYARGSPG